MLSLENRSQGGVRCSKLGFVRRLPRGRGLTVGPRLDPIKSGCFWLWKKATWEKTKEADDSLQSPLAPPPEVKTLHRGWKSSYCRRRSLFAQFFSFFDCSWQCGGRIHLFHQLKRQTQPCLISVCSSGSLDKLPSACPLPFWPACFPSLLSCRLSAVALRWLHGGAPPCLLALSPKGFGFTVSKHVRAQSPRCGWGTFVG